MLNGSASINNIVGLIILAIVILSVALLVTLIIDAEDKVKEGDLLIAQMAKRLPFEQQRIFVDNYQSVRRKASQAMLLAFFFGGIGAHKFYLGQTGLGIAYLLFFWTTIPGWIALVELFFLADTVVRINQQRAKEIVALLGAPLPLAALVS